MKALSIRQPLAWAILDGLADSEPLAIGVTP